MGQAATIAAGGLQAAGSVMQGRERARAARAEAQNLGIQRTEVGIRANQEEAARREALAGDLQAMQVALAGSGVAAGSPTVRAIMSGGVRDAEADVSTARYNALAQQDSLRRAQVEAKRSARAAMLSGYMGAANAGFQTYSNLQRRGQ